MILDNMLVKISYYLDYLQTQTDKLKIWSIASTT